MERSAQQTRFYVEEMRKVGRHPSPDLIRGRGDRRHVGFTPRDGFRTRMAAARASVEEMRRLGWPAVERLKPR
jgi:hypothetical protein